MKRYEMQVMMRDDSGRNWVSVRPTKSSPYSYTTQRETVEMLDLCYPDQEYGIDVRVIAVEI